MASHTISIVVPAFNEERLLPSSLDCIRESSAAFTETGWTTELVVCDNNSTDRTAEIASAAGARVVFEPVNQISRARNAGAAVATGDWLLFVDADSFPTRALFADVVSTIGSGRCLGGGATVRIDRQGLFYDAAVGCGTSSAGRFVGQLARSSSVKPPRFVRLAGSARSCMRRRRSLCSVD